MKTIKDYILENLDGETQKTALDFVEYLSSYNLVFYRDTCSCWKDKIYYWVKYGENCVCFIAIKDPDEPENNWTVWSDETPAYENSNVSDDVKKAGWSYVDHCGGCGACDGGTAKVVFGKTFERVCGCTFRIDNALQKDISFLKAIVDLYMNFIK